VPSTRGILALRRRRRVATLRPNDRIERATEEDVRAAVARRVKAQFDREVALAVRRPQPPDEALSLRHHRIRRAGGTMSEKPAVVIDPICGMRVDVVTAEAEGLTVDLDGRIFAFCRPDCRASFLMDPVGHVTGAEASAAGPAEAMVGRSATEGSSGTSLPEIDAGFRLWYENCACCLGDAFPDVKAQLDAERAAAAQDPVAPGICEVAEGG
jgi:YHS domain-containing protein